MQGCGKTFKRRIGARKDDVSAPLCAMAACTAAADAKWIREREEKWGSKGGKWEEVGKWGKVWQQCRGGRSAAWENLSSLWASSLTLAKIFWRPYEPPFSTKTVPGLVWSQCLVLTAKGRALCHQNWFQSDTNFTGLEAKTTCTDRDHRELQRCVV